MNTKKRIIVILIFVIWAAGKVAAQQDAMYSQYMFNMLAVNPAYAGSRKALMMTGLVRSQWCGIEGAPNSQTFSIDGPVKRKKIGLGLVVYNDKAGIISNTGAYSNYSYKLRVNRKTSLALGLQLGISQYTANLTSSSLSATQPTVSDRSFQNNISTFMPNAGAGLYLSQDNKYYVGISIPSFFSVQTNTELNVNKYNHLFAMAGYMIALNKDIKLKPSVLLKGVSGAPLQLDLNANVWMYEKLGLGLSYRPSAAVVAMVEIQVTNRLRVGYAYDHSTTALQSYNHGSHELVLRLDFPYGKDRALYCPDFLR